MAEKWADYLISMVRYNERETHINKVLSHADNSDSVGPGYERTRANVVELLKAGYTFVTIYKNNSGSYNRGAEVRIVRIEGTDYIRTDPDATKKDNLGTCPGSSLQRNDALSEREARATRSSSPRDHGHLAATAATDAWPRHSWCLARAATAAPTP
jgi:hypothetical protein